MPEAIKIIIKETSKPTNEVVLQNNQKAQLAADEGMQISFLDAETGQPIEKLQAKKSSSDLVVAKDNGDELLTIENYYDVDDVEVGTLTDQGFVRFEAVDVVSGETVTLVSETSYTPLVADMLNATAATPVVSPVGASEFSNGTLWAGLGAVAIGASAISLSSSDDGKDGAAGSQGQKGESGQDGKSAYEVAVEYGYKGSFEQWVAEMKGEDYVDPTNTAPSANDTSISTKEDVSFSGKLSTATDSDGDELKYELNVQAKNGTAVVNQDGSFIYLPNKDYNGEDSFTYSISDGRGGVITKTANIIIDAVNDAPESENTVISLSSAEIIQALEDGKLIEGQLAEATDVDGDDLVYFLDWHPGIGNWYPGYSNLIVEENGSYSIEPYMFLNYMNPYYGGSLNDISGEAVFSYTISDGNGGQIIRDAILDFKNTAPNSENSSIKTSQSLSVEGVLFEATDIDNDELTYAIHEQAANGVAIVNDDGSYSYVPNGEFIGKDSFTYIISDGYGGEIMRTANINVVQNNIPVAKDTLIKAVEDESVRGMLEEATDADGDSLVYKLKEPASNGDVIVNKDGSYSYLSNPDFYGEDSFTYTIDDGNYGVITKTAFITVEPVNDAPISNENAYGYGVEDEVLEGQLPDAYDSDGDELLYSLDSDAENGKATVNADGSYVYEPNPDFNGYDYFTYLVSDGNGGTITKSVEVYIQPVNDLPTHNGNIIEVVEDGLAFGSLNDITEDIDGDYLYYELGEAPAQGSVTVNREGYYEYIPNPGFFGTDRFTYFVDDSSGEAVELEALVKVSSNNSPPVSKDSYISIEDGSAYEGRLEAASDADGDQLVYSLVTGPVNGELVLNADGSFSYTPDSNYNGMETFTYTIDDGNGGVITHKATLAIGEVNHAPISHIEREGTTVLSNAFSWKGSALKYTVNDELIFISPKGNSFVFERYDSAGELLHTADLKEQANYYELIDASIADDGRITILFKGSNTQHSIVRLDENGSLDYTFNPGGLEQEEQGIISFDYNVFVESISSNNDGEIVISGSNKIIKFNSEGAIDNSFNAEGWGTGIQGMVQTESNSWNNDKVQLLDSGDILYSGSSYVAKYNANGVLLNEFHTKNEISDIVVLDDGSVLTLLDSGYGDVNIIKLKKDLSLDTSFSIAKDVDLLFESVRYFKAEKLAVNNEGGILVVGKGEDSLDNSSVQVFLSFNVDGSLNESFNVDSSDSYTSFVIKDIDRTYYSGDDVTDSLHIDSEGGILVGNNLDGSNLIITKYLQSGIVANDFGPKADLGVLQNTDYIFQVYDFGFKDVDGDSLKAVFIDGIPEKGELLLKGVAVTEGQKVDVADIEDGNLVFRPEKVIIQDDYASLTYRVQDDGGTENGAIDISHNQATLVIDVLPSTAPSSEVMVVAEIYDTNALLVNMESATINPYLYNDVSTDSSSQAGYSKWIERPKNLPMLEDVLDISESSEEQLFLNSNGKNTSAELGANELQQEGSSALGLVVTQTQNLEQAYIAEQASYII